MAIQTVYQKFTLLTGGTAAAMDSIDGNSLVDGDRAYPMYNGFMYHYLLDDDSGATAFSPLVIAPATNPGTKRWILQSITSSISLTTVADTASGMLINMTAGENLAFGNTVYCKSDGKLWKANADVVGTMPTVAIAAAAVTANNSGLFLTYGAAHVHTLAPAWTLGGMIYTAKTAGGLTQDVSGYTTGDQVQILGIAVAADVILFNPSYVLVEIS